MTILMKQFAQPYVGSPAEMQDFLNPARTTLQIADIANSVNTQNKYAGKTVFDTDLFLGYIAVGPAAVDDWYLNDGLGLTTVTPS